MHPCAYTLPIVCKRPTLSAYIHTYIHTIQESYLRNIYRYIHTYKYIHTSGVPMGPGHVFQRPGGHHRVPGGQHRALHDPAGRALQGLPEGRRCSGKPVPAQEDGGTHTYIHTYIYTYIQTYAYIYTHILTVQIHTQAYVHTYIHTYIHKHT